MTGVPASPNPAAGGGEEDVAEVPEGRFRRYRRTLLGFLYAVRTEGDSPARQAAAVALGVFIGCTPFYGFHFFLCIFFARIFRLNQIRTYIGAHISTPVLLPFLVIAEVQVGRFLRGEMPVAIHLSALRQLRPWRSGLDLFTGSLVVGLILAGVFALVTYLLARRLRRFGPAEMLIDATSRRYIEAGFFAWEFVRGKLRHDPIYLALLEKGTLPPDGLLLDLGCGRGILLALLAMAREKVAAVGPPHWPPGWPPPPPHLTLHGIEGRPRMAKAARYALGADGTIEVADLRQAHLPAARVVTLFDVLHYLPAGDQETLLDRAAAALEPGGLFLLREADAAAGAAFTRTRLAERLCAIARGHWAQHFHYRTAGDWADLLAARGLQVEARPMTSTAYANVLLIAHCSP